MFRKLGMRIIETPVNVEHTEMLRGDEDVVNIAAYLASRTP
jgi:hypothetical protein